MSSRVTFHSQLSSIMDTMACSVLSQVCKLVDEDSGELRGELSRLLVVNSSLADKVNSLECELTALRRDPSMLCESGRSVGVQTVCFRDGDAYVTEPPTIAGIFGKDWCMNLWKDRDPHSLDKLTTQSFEKSVTTPSDQISEAEVVEGVYVDDSVNSCQQATLCVEEHEKSISEEPEQLSVDYQADDRTCNLSFDQVAEKVVSACDVEKPSMQLISINATAEAFNTYIIPIEEDDDVQFVQESQQELIINDATGSGLNEQQTLSSKISRKSSALERVLQGTTWDPNKDKYTCQICSRAFFHRGTLTHHMRSHRSTFCSICKQHFPKAKKLITHTCVPPVPHKKMSKSCELCGKTFANQSALSIHYVVHTGEKPYRCSLCGKGFTQKGNLKCHLRIHSGERPFRCVRCGKTFTQKVNLNHHLMAHKHRKVVEEQQYQWDILKNLAK